MTYRQFGQLANALLLGVFLLQSPSISLAQNDSAATIDSLERVLKNAVEDTTKMNALERLSLAHRFADLEKAKSYCHQRIALAEKNKDVERMAGAYLALSSYHYQGAALIL